MRIVKYKFNCLCSKSNLFNYFIGNVESNVITKIIFKEFITYFLTFNTSSTFNQRVTISTKKQ